MRRKNPTQGNGSYNNQRNNKPRYQQGGGDRQQGNHHNRPRKNYPAMREKYLAQARDALASGDRVLAENYFQHADHCYRMMMEEGYQQPRQQQQASNQQENTNEASEAPSASSEEFMPENTSQLPAFLTVNYEQPDAAKSGEPPAQNWEERDA